MSTDGTTYQDALTFAKAQRGEFDIMRGPNGGHHVIAVSAAAHWKKLGYVTVAEVRQEQTVREVETARESEEPDPPGVFRFHTATPAAMVAVAPSGKEWARVDPEGRVLTLDIDEARIVKASVKGQSAPDLAQVIAVIVVEAYDIAYTKGWRAACGGNPR